MPDLVVRTDNIQVTLSASRIIFIIFVTILFMITSRLWKFTKKRIRRLMRKMKDSAIYNMECPICLNPLQTPVKSDCGHAFCIECLYTFWEEPSWKSICSICRAPLENLRLVDDIDYTDQERRELENKIYIISSDSFHHNNWSPIPAFAARVFVILLWISVCVHVDYLLKYSDEVYNSFYVFPKQMVNKTDIIV